jgi:hypothetical protein
MVSVIRPNGLGSPSATKRVLHEPVRARFPAGTTDPRPDQPKGGNVEGKSGLFAAKEPTSWIIEEVSLF